MHIVPNLWTQPALQELIQSRLKGFKFIVVSNREPFIHRHQGDQIECFQPASGMATALRPILMASGGTWIAHGSGNADREVVDSKDRVPVPPHRPCYTLRRVWLTKEQENGFYYGLSNEGLWPLCHITFTRPVFRPQDWETYKECNRLFAEAVMEEAGDQPSFVFIQDYHFCLLPRMLKEMGAKNLVIAQFWHIPWPNPEVFRAFPWAQELIDGLLGNDLLGFHVRYHCQNFLETVDRTLEAKIERETWNVSRGGRTTAVRAFPISIDFADHDALARSKEVEKEMEVWREKLKIGDRLVGAGIERLDYTKGIPDRIRALDYLFETKPEWRGRFVFVQIAVPSRSHLASYQAIEEEVDALARRLNERWSTPDWKPILLLKKHHNDVQMTALHRLTRFFIVNALHDGMNLVAKEYVASRFDEDGVLVLSRFAGAQGELSDAVPVNPFAVDETAEAIHTALAMPESERQRRMRRMREHVAHYNVYRWAGKILSNLLKFDLPEGNNDGNHDTLE